MRRAWLSALLALVTAVAVTGCSGGGTFEDDCETRDGVLECAPGTRAPAPKVAGELLDGARYDIAQERGNVVVVNFWGSWCAPCVAEADDLESTYQATRDKGVRFLGVNVNDGRDKAKAFEQGRVTYPSLFDPGSRVALDFQVPPNSVPATIVLDRDGRIAVVIRRGVTQDVLRPIVERVAAEGPAPDGSR
ncbi:Thiol-disulfide isomerase or thioredoxin [Micromonospora pattaloongensis]|uniref:Thiol-disulfide isomerase or thioredoxin n=1 Tax=Micromonospora pattaloongensis TaxID=405436 RepID=A0A1H3SGH6_9ACTN|nr:TlpA disulfide reductase family protein [Micromonospora pattaloongensis]SDZ36837.1 Thiol-disulfide isomerase or thioredoxin [Micromonospora pattaloongensis]